VWQQKAWDVGYKDTALPWQWENHAQAAIHSQHRRTEDDLEILSRILLYQTQFKITSLLHTPDFAPDAWIQYVTMWICTREGRRIPRRFHLRSRSGTSTPHLSSGSSSAMTLVSDRNTRVFRTALTALTEPCTLWRRFRRYPLHTYLLYFLVTYTHHQNDTCVTLFAVAAVTLKPFTQRVAMFMPFSGRRFFGNAAGAPGNHSYYLSFNAFQNLCIQFVFSSMYLCIYIPT